MRSISAALIVLLTALLAPGAATAADPCSSPFPLLCDLISEGFLENGAGPFTGHVRQTAFMTYTYRARTRAGYPHPSAIHVPLSFRARDMDPGVVERIRTLPRLSLRQNALARALLATGDPLDAAAAAEFLDPNTADWYFPAVFEVAPALARTLPILSGLRLDELPPGIPPLAELPTEPWDQLSEWALHLAEDTYLETPMLVYVERAVPGFVGPDGIRNTTDDLPTGPGPDGVAGFQVVLAGASAEECTAALPTGAIGGLNANGDCIRIPDRQPQNLDGRAAITDDTRPPSAPLEPPDLTGLTQLGGALAARPRLPDGGLVFPISPSGASVHSRRVDPETGAPVQRGGLLECKTAPGGPTGPNGTGADPLNQILLDDEVPFKGNCLLFNDDGTRRPPDETALYHSADQTFFHTLCTMNMNLDTGTCGPAQLNTAEWVGPGSLVLAGDPGFLNAAVRGFETIREKGRRFQGLDVNVDASRKLFGEFQNLPRPNLSELEVDQQALIGCGPRWASGCTTERAQGLVEIGILERPTGGVDYMNSDAAVLLQEWGVLKGLTPGHLIGHRGSGELSYFEAGITAPAQVLIQAVEVDFTPEVAHQLEGDGPPGTATVRALADAVDPLDATDFQIEPFKFAPDPNLLEQGVVVFDPSRPVPEGENCTRALNGPEEGCTNLEILSANLERLYITDEIIGPDGMFDPPESLEELLAMLDGDPTNDLTGDPISGPDGIFFNNVDTTGDGLRDSKALRVRREFVQHETFVQDPLDCLAFPNLDACYLDITQALLDTGEITQDDLVDPWDPNDPDAVFFVKAKPIIRLRKQATDTEPASNVQAIMDNISAADLQKLILGEAVPFALGSAGFVEPTDPNDPAGFQTKMTRSVRDRLVNPNPMASQDLDRDEVPDLDQDANMLLDFADDYTPGPISDDNILCGSGIRGDPLQDALQVEFADATDWIGLTSVFPNGLLPRTPSLCTDSVGFLSLTGESAPGRRDFRWHRSLVPTDGDLDSIADVVDNCVGLQNGDQADTDGDEIGDACDNCRQVSNAGQTDDDQDGIGNLCDGDFDQSGFCNVTDLLRFLEAFGKQLTDATCPDSAGDPTGSCARYDLTGKGAVINVSDLLALIDSSMFGTLTSAHGCAPADDGMVHCPLP